MCSGSGERGRIAFEEPFEELGRSLALLRHEDLESLPASSMGEDLVAVGRHINSCEAEFSRRLHRFEIGQGFVPSGALDSKPWLRWQCRLTPAASSDRLEVTRQLTSLPLVTHAFAEGAISYQHASMIARTAERLGEKMEAQAEGILVDAAKELDPARLRIVITHLRHCMDPDGVQLDANECHDRRFMHLSETLDGVFVLDGRLDSVGGATLRTALNAVMGPRSEQDDRTPTQRRADALVDLARNQLDAGMLPDVGGQKPHLVVSVEMATLSREAGSRAAELEWSQPIPAETARRLGCDCSITPLACGHDGEALNAGRASRVIPPHVRRALIARDRGCRFPGCDRPPAWTDGHHLVHWADGGQTLLYNLVLLCRRHHRRVHEDGWRLAWGAERTLVAVPP